MKFLQESDSESSNEKEKMDHDPRSLSRESTKSNLSGRDSLKSSMSGRDSSASGLNTNNSCKTCGCGKSKSSSRLVASPAGLRQDLDSPAGNGNA